MTDLLSIGGAWLQGKRRAHMARTVTYKRGASTATISNATVGETVFRIDTGYGVFERHETRDYIVAVSDLGALSPPQRGDQIREVIDGVTEIFEVMAPGAEPDWKYHDLDHSELRIHTKHVGSDS